MCLHGKQNDIYLAHFLELARYLRSRLKISFDGFHPHAVFLHSPKMGSAPEQRHVQPGARHMRTDISSDGTRARAAHAGRHGA